jgi:DNA-directed RNA polymerase subunit RPC12/RpoP
MKGRIQCPHCGKDFIAIEKDGHIKEIQKCPNCGKKISLKRKNKNDENCEKTSSDNYEECNWEEHGEPRKTILSSFKPRTDKPMLASLLLLTVVIIGISSAIFPEAYLQTPLDVLSATGSTGAITLFVQDQDGTNMDNILVWVDPLFKNSTNTSGFVTLENLSLGKQHLFISINGTVTSEAKEIFILPFHTETTITVMQDSTSLKIQEQLTDLVWCSSIVIILSIATIFGFIASWKRQHFDAAVIGSIVGIFTIGFYFIGSILSIIAIILLLLSKEEFDDGKKGKSF